MDSATSSPQLMPMKLNPVLNSSTKFGYTWVASEPQCCDGSASTAVRLGQCRNAIGRTPMRALDQPAYIAAGRERIEDANWQPAADSAELQSPLSPVARKVAPGPGPEPPAATPGAPASAESTVARGRQQSCAPAGGPGAAQPALKDDDVPMRGPNFCKLLMSDFIAGAIIGRNGMMIGEIELISRCQMQLSTPGNFFPGTKDRICIVGGTMRSLENCIQLVLMRLRDACPNSARPLIVRLSVPSSAVSGLIGHCGDVAKRLSSASGCKISASPRVPGFQERLVTIAGVHDALLQATLQVVRSIQGDPHLRQHLQLAYDVKLPLGIWAGKGAHSADPETALLDPALAKGYTKRELIEYLKKAAPQEILLRYQIFGNIKNTVKSKGHDKLIAAVNETWEERMGCRTMSSAEVKIAVKPGFSEVQRGPSLAAPLGSSSGCCKWSSSSPASAAARTAQRHGVPESAASTADLPSLSDVESDACLPMDQPAEEPFSDDKVGDPGDPGPGAGNLADGNPAPRPKVDHRACPLAVGLHLPATHNVASESLEAGMQYASSLFSGYLDALGFGPGRNARP